MYKKLTCSLIFILIPAFFYGVEYDNALNGIPGTPTSYILTMKRVEFMKSGGTWVTFASGSDAFDIATVSAGGNVGLFGQGSFLPSGTYTKMRIVVSRYFTISAAIEDAGSGQRARTDTNNLSNATLNNGFENLTQLGVASTDGGVATAQTMPLPFGLNFGEGEDEIGIDQMRFELDIDTFTVQAGGNIPTIRVEFDLTDACVFKTTGIGTAVVMPDDPHPRVTIIQ